MGCMYKEISLKSIMSQEYYMKNKVFTVPSTSRGGGKLSILT